METNLGYQENLCASCQEYLLTYDPPLCIKGQTYETFKDAVDKKCFICSVIWHRNQQDRGVMPISRNIWFPLSHQVLKHGTHPPNERFNCLEVMNVEFLFFPTEETPDFPVLNPIINQDRVSTIGLPWLEHCQHNHPKCNKTEPSKLCWHPTRLLDIGTRGHTNWRLCVKSEDIPSSAPVSYLTLSYRWSSDPQIRLLSSNFETLRRGLPNTDLPVLFQDFIHVAHQFSIRYVWIDALCIIQDSKDDWERESTTMRQVYSNSICTIAACGSGSSGDTLFHDRDLDFIRPGIVQTCWFSGPGLPRSYYIYERSYLERQTFEGGLRNRGWVFQEWYLSPRILYFAKHQLIWECRTQHRCEVFPEGVPEYQSTKQMSMEMVPLTETESKLRYGMSVGTADLWFKLVNQYTKCDLTFPSDKLNAMAGIAKAFEEATGDEYVAGLWKSRFVEMLDWSVYNHSQIRSEEYRAPSWSWASVDSPVRAHYLHDETARLTADVPKVVHAELISVDVVTRTPDKMSTVLSAIAVLKARIVPIVCSRADGTWSTFRGLDGGMSNSGVTTLCYVDDLSGWFKEGQQLWCMILFYCRADDDHGGYYMTCLLLDQHRNLPGHPEAYKRIGMLWVSTRCDDEGSIGGVIKEIKLV